MIIVYTWERADTFQATAEIPDGTRAREIEEIGYAIIADEIPPGVTVYGPKIIACGSSENLDWVAEKTV